MLNSKEIIYPSKNFFKNGKKIVWSGSEFKIVFTTDKIVNVIKLGLPFLNNKYKSKLKFTSVLKLFFCTTNFMVLYFYAIGNGYEADFDLDSYKVTFTTKGTKS